MGSGEKEKLETLVCWAGKRFALFSALQVLIYQQVLPLANGALVAEDEPGACQLVCFTEFDGPRLPWLPLTRPMHA